MGGTFIGERAIVLIRTGLLIKTFRTCFAQRLSFVPLFKGSEVYSEYRYKVWALFEDINMYLYKTWTEPTLWFHVVVYNNEINII